MRSRLKRDQVHYLDASYEAVLRLARFDASNVLVSGLPEVYFRTSPA